MTCFRLKNLSARGWSWLILGCIGLGLLIRFTELASLIYWHDEAYTSLRIAGRTTGELHDLLFSGTVISVRDLMTYQQIDPERGLEATMQSLIVEDVQHPPLYYALVWGWAGLWGSGIGTVRALSALIGGLVLPAAWWLGQELFGHGQTQFSRLTSGLFVALIAVSPYQLLFAQEAREYGLWALTTILSSAALLRSLRLKTLSAWGLYAITLTAGLYSHLFAVLTLAGHGLYVGIVNRSWQQWMRFGAATALAVVAIAPWLRFVLNPAARQGTSWTAVWVPLAVTFRGWGNHVLRGFTLPPADGSLPPPLLYGLLPLLLGLLVYSFVHLCQKTDPSVWGLPLLLIGSAFLPLALMDIVQGGQRSLPSRYLVPLYVGLLLPVAYLFVAKIVGQSRRQRLVWGGLCGLFVAMNVGVCFAIAGAKTAWTKEVSYNLLPVAAEINAAPRPLLISTAYGINTGTLLALSHYLKPETRLQLIDDRNQPDFLMLPELPNAPGSVFLLNGSLPLRLWLERENSLTAEMSFSDLFLTLWRLHD